MSRGPDGEVDAPPPEPPQGVGKTALGVARVRALESQREDRLFDDPYAQAFVDAAPGAFPEERAVRERRAAHGPLASLGAAFSAHAVELRPRRSSGRRAGHHEVTVRNRGNTHLDARLEAVDDDGVARPHFAPPLLDLGPGEQRVSRLAVRPPAPILVGRDRDLPLKVLAHAGDREPVSADATYRQRAWVPWWAIPLLIALVALVVLILQR